MSSKSDSPEKKVPKNKQTLDLVKALEMSQHAQQKALKKLKEHVVSERKEKAAAQKRAENYVELSRELRQLGALRLRERERLENKIIQNKKKLSETKEQNLVILRKLQEDRDELAKELEQTKKLLEHNIALKTKTLTAKRILQNDLDYAQKRLAQANNQEQRHIEQSLISVLSHPYPYRSVVAISSDIDDASFASVSMAHRCFYGLEPGFEDVALELSNSYWLVCSDKSKTCDIFLYDEDLKPAAHHDKLLPFFKTSLFDTLHTYGQFGEERRFSREAAEYCAEKLSAHNLEPEFWTYHGDREQFQNGVPTDKVWRADDKESPYYHFDLLRNTSLKYIRIPPSRRLDQVHPVLEQQTFRDGSTWYAVNSHSILVDPDANQRTQDWLDKLEAMDKLNYERRRIVQPSSIYPDKIQTWMPEMLPEQLSEHQLDSIVEGGHHVLITQHLTKSFCVSAFSLEPVRQALHRLSTYQKSEKILVTTPVRLVNYERVRQGLSYKLTILKSVKRIDITIDSVCDLFEMKSKISSHDLQGIGFKISKDLPQDYEVRLHLGKEKVSESKILIVEGTGERVIYVPWRSKIEAQKDRIMEWDKTFLNPA